MSRLDKLLKMLEAEPNDAFVLYGIAQEHANAERHADAITSLPCPRARLVGTGQVVAR